jgi:hypothetical protein
MVLAEEMHFYNKNEKRLAKWYPNSFVVIKGQQVYGGGRVYWKHTCPLWKNLILVLFWF